MEIICAVIQNEWDSSTLKRRVQHYGYEFNYGFRGVDFDAQTPPLPQPFIKIAERIADVMHLPPHLTPDQVCADLGSVSARFMHCLRCLMYLEQTAAR